MSWPRIIDTERGAQFGVNIEFRRQGEVSVSINAEQDEHTWFQWMSADEAREFGRALTSAARDAEEMEAARAS